LTTDCGWSGMKVVAKEDEMFQRPGYEK